VITEWTLSGVKTCAAPRCFLIPALALVLLGLSIPIARAQTAPVRLDDLERMALEQNPTLPQARVVRAAKGA
jgi:hypothetical protein